MMTHIVSLSGGIGSWYTARIVVDEIAEEDPVVLLFADTLIEDEDTYAFLDAAVKDLGLPLTRIADGRTPWQVFKDERFLGNSRIDPCSKILKRELIDKWVRKRYTPDNCVKYIGIDWTEEHRLTRHRERSKPWVVRAPLCEDRWKHITREHMHAEAARRGLPKQRLYTMGMPHANCGGGCVKAGITHFMRLYDRFPARFAEWEANEQGVIDHLEDLGCAPGTASMLKDRRGGTTKPMTLRELRARIEAKDPTLPKYDWGGCGCAID